MGRIARIFAPVLADVSQVLAKLRRSDSSGRSTSIPPRRLRRHADQPGRARSANQPLKNRFRLIVSMVCQNRAIEMVASDPANSSIRAARYRADGLEAIFASEDSTSRPHRDRAGEPMRPGKLPNEFRILPAGLAAGLMIEMGHMERQVGPGAEQSQEGHAIRPAADAHRPPPRRDGGCRGANGSRFIRRHLNVRVLASTPSPSNHTPVILRYSEGSPRGAAPPKQRSFG